MNYVQAADYTLLTSPIKKAHTFNHSGPGFSWKSRIRKPDSATISSEMVAAFWRRLDHGKEQADEVGTDEVRTIPAIGSDWDCIILNSKRKIQEYDSKKRTDMRQKLP